MSEDRDSAALRKQLAQAAEEIARFKRRIIRLKRDRDRLRISFDVINNESMEAARELLLLRWNYQRLLRAVTRMAKTDRRKNLN